MALSPCCLRRRLRPETFNKYEGDDDRAHEDEHRGSDAHREVNRGGYYRVEGVDRDALQAAARDHEEHVEDAPGIEDAEQQGHQDGGFAQRKRDLEEALPDVGPV